MSERVAPESPAKNSISEHDPVAFDFARAIKEGNVEHVTRLLTEHPTLATSLIDSRSPLHLFADAPGRRPNPAAIVNALVAAGADLNAHAINAWHHETALHWAASNDDVPLIDALLDAGADIEHPGSSINGGPPIQSALGYAQWKAVRRLWERGAQIGLSHAASLGLMPLITSLVEPSTDTTTPATPDDINVAFWNACRAGQLEAARYLLAHGADLNWPAPWDGTIPLDAALGDHQPNVAAWLNEIGAHPGNAPADTVPPAPKTA